MTAIKKLCTRATHKEEIKAIHKYSKSSVLTVSLKQLTRFYMNINLMIDYNSKTPSKNM